MALMPQMDDQSAEGAAPDKPDAQPSGMSPGAQPSANSGMQAAATARTAFVVRALEQILPMAGAASELGRDVMKAISSLSKHVAAPEASPGIAMNATDNIQNQQRQMMPMIAALRAQSAPKPVQAPPDAGA